MLRDPDGRSPLHPLYHVDTCRVHPVATALMCASWLMLGAALVALAWVVA